MQLEQKLLKVFRQNNNEYDWMYKKAWWVDIEILQKVGEKDDKEGNSGRNI